MNDRIALIKRATRILKVRNAQRTQQLLRREPVGRQTFRFEIRVHRTRFAAVNRNAGTVRYMLQFAHDLFRHTVELMRIVEVAVQRRIHDRHIINLDGLHNPSRDARCHTIHILIELIVELQQAVFAVLPHKKADGDNRNPRARHRVDILDAINLIEQSLKARGDEPLNILSASSGVGHHDVRQGHHDLRFLFARRHGQRKHTRNQTYQNNENRQIAAKKTLHNTRQK